MIDRVLELMSGEIRENHIIVRQDVQDGLLDVEADPIQIEQVLINLLRNAIDSLKQTGINDRHIVVGAHMVTPSLLELSVEDNGTGLQDNEKVFTPFYTTKEDGMGMGLSISDTIISEHKGKIRVESFPGQGTTFTVELPASTTHLLESLAS